MTKQSFKFRSDTTYLRRWRRVAKSRGQTLSEFIRDSLNAASAGLVTGEDLTRHLRAIRTTLNAAQSVRTEEQRAARIAIALAHINSLIHLKGIPDAE